MTQMIRWTRRHFFVFTYANSILYRTSYPLQLLIPQEAKTACQAELVDRIGDTPIKGSFSWFHLLQDRRLSHPASLPASRPSSQSLVVKPLSLWAAPGTAAHTEPSF